MTKKKQKAFLFVLIIFSIYCALTVGETWDESFHLEQGRITFNYLFSFGRINENISLRENYSAIYWSILYILTSIFPSQYQIEANHFVNVIISFGAIIGIGKLCRELFNKQVGKIIFLISFFYPVFFGHMLFNNKDTILAFCHIWITYLIFRYLKKQSNENNINYYLFFIALLGAMGMGIQLVFLGSLTPLFIFILVDIFFAKKIINENFSYKKFIYDLIRCFGIFYFILILFWIDAHQNIFSLPYNIIVETLSSNFWTGWPYNLVDGNYYISSEIPKNYLIINFLYKTPEYILLSYMIFVILTFRSSQFFKMKFYQYNYKLLLVLLIIIFPNLILFFIPYPIYDGMRLFLWTIPYFCIIPGLAIYYLIENFSFLKNKITLSLLSIFIFYFLFNFFSITPYQYTYLNFLNGSKEKRYQKFENDYWGSSINELINKSHFKKDEILMIASCGVNSEISKNYLKNKGYIKVKLVHPDQADYIIMTNRAVISDKIINQNKQITNCFDKFHGENLFEVKRNGMLLSVIRKI